MGEGVDPTLAAALAARLAERSALLAAGARRVGWKLGMGERERIGPGPVVGHLTSASQLAPGETYRIPPEAALHADAEVALHLGRAVTAQAGADAARRAIAGYGPALELVDLAGDDDAERIVATNVFHRAFAPGPPQPRLPPQLTARLVAGRSVRTKEAARADYSDLLVAVAWLLEAAGERLESGDVVITGWVVQLPVAPGDHVEADLGGLGRVDLGVDP